MGHFISFLLSNFYQIEFFSMSKKFFLDAHMKWPNLLFFYSMMLNKKLGDYLSIIQS